MTIDDAVKMQSLLPPQSSDFEFVMESAMRANPDLSAIGDLWNPLLCPAPILPFLAWGLAISQWDSDWSEAQKRAAIADAIPFHRRKGTRASVREVLERFHPLLQIIEWFEPSGSGQPYTFEIQAPAADIPASFLTQETAAAIIRDVTAVKPVRAHFDFVQSVDAMARIFAVSAGRNAIFGRNIYAAAHDDDASWQRWLLSEDGQPLQDENGQFLEP